MEEDVGVKGTVTRLRRRLSVEKTEDVSSPSTPTKKRGGRLAAKPQLELIDENAQISSPKKTRRKSMAEAEEKPVTPSRRSTRIKSNTSIVSETVSQTTDSPRARRALRRTSQAGSDNEGPVTPARQTRRTRKDSASSVENQEPAPPSRPLQVVEMVIAEEPETEPANKSKSSPKAIVEELLPNSARKSNRLLVKRNRRSGSYKSDHDLSSSLVENKSLNVSAKDENLENKTKCQDRANKSGEPKELCEELSESNKSLSKTLDAEAKINISNHNKSVPSIDDKKKKRNRSASWPMLISSPANDNIMCSDNEQSKKKKKKSGKNFSWMNNSGSSLNDTSIKENKNKTVQNENGDLKTLIESPSKRKKRKSETSFSKELEKPSDPVQMTEAIASNNESAYKNTDKQPENRANIKDSSENAENASLKSDSHGISSDMVKFFEKAPSSVEAIVYFEDSDSNSTATTSSKIQQLDSEDQCVPVVKHDISPLATNVISNAQENIFTSQPLLETETCNEEINQVNGADNSCEPMDVDETIPEDFFQKSQQSVHTSINERKSVSQTNSISEEPNKSKRNSSITANDTSKIISEEPNKSKRKSSITANDTSKIENKSTLILSQLKDVSKTSDSAQSPKPSTNEILSKSSTYVHDNNKRDAKCNLSLNDLKGTPLKQIDVQKLNMQTSTPIATQQIDKTLKTEEKSGSPKNNRSNLSKSIEKSRSSEEDSDEESGQKSNYLIDDEAEEASDDYESGDSRDDEERQYEDEHEIVEQGETLGSDEDLTDDSDYEKDSFVVSSDAEDDDLLSGSGDDLSMSDKELSMSKKSKEKYDERKINEQKNASREMFESRHKLSNSEKSPAHKIKNSRMRIDSSLLESDEEIVVKPKKSNRLRLDSTLDISQNEDDASEPLNKSNKKSNKSLQKSICNENAIDEKEITVCNESVVDFCDPLQVQFKQEPETPQRDLDISVVQVTSQQDIENVEVDENKSVFNKTEIDPLQATMAVVEASDSSENEEIMQNYDSVLNELNKNKKGKLSSNNLSLNIDKKAKKDKNEPLLDELNLTHTKRAKKIFKEQSQDVVDSKTHKVSKAKQDSSASDSSSIYLKLLFSEDNCESSDESNNKKDKEISEEEEEMFVPLRKSTGKTNIRESGSDLFFIDTTGAQDKGKEDGSKLAEAPVEVLFSSKKKQKKDKLDSYQNKIEINENAQPTQTESVKKKEKQKKRHSADQSVEGTIIMEEYSSKRKSSDTVKAQESVSEAPSDDGPNSAPVEAMYENEKASALDASTQKSENTPSSETGSSSKKKKKKKKKQPAVLEQSVLFDDDSDGAPEETAYRSEKAADLEANLQKPENTEPAVSGGSKKKKKKQASEQSAESLILEESNSNSKKRKRKSSDPGKAQNSAAEGTRDVETEGLNESSSAGRQKKKRKMSHQHEAIDLNDVPAENYADAEKQAKKKKKRNHEVNFQNIATEAETSQPPIKKNKKRKERDEDTDRKNSKVSKENSFHEVHMPPLPDSILNQLDDKPRKITQEPKVISTSKFVVENARQKRAKPSKYLEESIYLDDNLPLAKKDKSRMKKPKVLPFIPTASISDSGFTTNFQIKKTSQNVEFVAGPVEITFSKETYLQKKGIKRLGTYDHYKKQISRKISKF